METVETAGTPESPRTLSTSKLWLMMDPNQRPNRNHFRGRPFQPQPMWFWWWYGYKSIPTQHITKHPQSAQSGPAPAIPGRIRQQHRHLAGEDLEQHRRQLGEIR
jgi:hypothetical protein